MTDKDPSEQGLKLENRALLLPGRGMTDKDPSEQGLKQQIRFGKCRDPKMTDKDPSEQGLKHPSETAVIYDHADD